MVLFDASLQNLNDNFSAGVIVRQGSGYITDGSISYENNLLKYNINTTAGMRCVGNYTTQKIDFSQYDKIKVSGIGNNPRGSYPFTENILLFEISDSPYISYQDVSPWGELNVWDNRVEEAIFTRASGVDEVTVDVSDINDEMYIVMGVATQLQKKVTGYVGKIELIAETGGGAGSGYIGNSLLSNKKMVGYNVPTSSAEGTKTESVNDISASAVSGKPKSGNGFARIKFLRDIDFFGFIEHMDKTTAATRFEYIGANIGYSKLTADYSAHTIDFKDWANFPILTKNKPYMVKTDGTADYQLSETDYTKKADGVTTSDVSNTSYDGCGAFAWLPKIYQKQEISGNDRIVKFSFTKKDGFEAVGFKMRENGEIKELEGIWIPMFYGSRQNSKLMSINNNASPMNGITIGEFKTAIENLSSRARFFGGAIKNVINDLLTMFALDADIQGIYGNGYMSSSATPTNNIKNGGAFYCSHSIEAIKIFHSILASQELWQYNPYFGVKDGYYYVSPYYEYDTKVITNVAEHRTSGYMKTNKYALIDDYGQIPDSLLVSSGMDSQPYYFIINTGTGSPKYSCAGGNYGTGRRGFLTATFDANYSYTIWDRSASPMILPPVGYKPN